MWLKVNEINFHPVLKDIENIFWFFLISYRTLTDYQAQNLIKYKNNANAGLAEFNNMLDRFNQTTNLKFKKRGNTITSNANIYNELVFFGKAIAILTFDYLSSSTYNAIINRDNEFQFLRFVRNGAAHNNSFNLKDENGEWKIGENQVIEWNDKKINREVNGTKVFNDFVSVLDIWLLAKHYSDKLTQLDNSIGKKAP